MTKLPKRAAAEIVELSAKSRNGLLRPSEVVDWAAANPQSKLHALFEWSDDVAAAKYRLDQARQFITLVKVTLPKFEKPVRFFVNLLTDRVSGDGYRRTDDVLKSPQRRQQLVDMARAELKAWADRFDHIQDYCQQHGQVVALLQAWEASL
jgi:hypothetical protein